ncbi:hypothetical protein K431DRAFT_293262 [Polychaeton citri CBS 116435]|uniref:Uncharacterized protein n=1 Tax=Polychaeton citri CBS 116435 TaxID=1314669 RepID=A0A9P4UQA4_9PEZI|nr:hypothetical protein K431DRAFT_293262 [Polychaeton citri CBS 116435]
MEHSNSNSNMSILFHLPGELRNEIYSLVLAGKDNRIIISSLPGSDHMYNRNQRPRLSLLQSCKSIRAETLPIYYGWNRFQILDAIKDLEAAFEFVESVEPGHRVFLRQVEVPTFDAPRAVEGMQKRGFELVTQLPKEIRDNFFTPKWLTFRHVDAEAVK